MSLANSVLRKKIASIHHKRSPHQANPRLCLQRRSRVRLRTCALQQPSRLRPLRAHPPTTSMSGAATSSSLEVVQVTTPAQIQHFKGLTREYLVWLAEDLAYQGIEEELAGLPGSFASEAGGTMLLAFAGGECIGAVALRALQGKQMEGVMEVEGLPVSAVGEMKRLFVRPAEQGRGVGRALASAALQEAQRLGYKAMVLDTLERLSSANKLYQRLGFQECAPYNHCPLPGVMYWVKRLE